MRNTSLNTLTTLFNFSYLFTDPTTNPKSTNTEFSRARFIVLGLVVESGEQKKQRQKKLVRDHPFKTSVIFRERRGQKLVKFADGGG